MSTNACAVPATYLARIERDGLEVTVEVVIRPEHGHRDQDETSEIVSMAATQVSARVQESIARGQLLF